MSMGKQHELKNAIRNKAAELGFCHCGFAEITTLFKEQDRFKQWLGMNYHAGMSYLLKHADKRFSPDKLVENAKTLISLALPYPPINDEAAEIKISWYVEEVDYHIRLKEKLNQLLEFLNCHWPQVKGRCFVDTAPVLDKVWAAKAGIGWQGKNSTIISSQHGSLFYIGEIVVDCEIEPDIEIENKCGSCTQCIDACPTGALEEPGVLNANKCLAYLTIEHKSDLPEFYKEKCNGYIFGCDICQKACPYNKALINSSKIEPAGFRTLTTEQWKNLSRDEFNAFFSNTSVTRTGYDKLMQNIKAVLGN